MVFSSIFLLNRLAYLPVVTFEKALPIDQAFTLGIFPAIDNVNSHALHLLYIFLYMPLALICLRVGSG
jgi:hypothetical protein